MLKFLRQWMEKGEALRNETPPAVEPRVPAPPANPLLGYPKTYLVADETRDDVFDPSLRHYGRAFRLADPALEHTHDRLRWHAAREAVVEHLLRTIAESPWRERLVLRGSVLLRAQIGDAARAPGDIDWVVLPPELKSGDAEATRMIDDIAQRVVANPQAGFATIDAGRVARDAIWTYERAEGVRLTFVWQADGLPPGTAQLDFVFAEPLRDAPVATEIPTRAGPLWLLGATPELSLAWKLLWLGTDDCPQGKDLYDAVLLAECTTLPASLLARVVADTHDRQPMPLPPQIDAWQIDWDNFLLEYPWIEGSLDDWKRRLAAAIAPGCAA